MAGIGPAKLAPPVRCPGHSRENTHTNTDPAEDNAPALDQQRTHAHANTCLVCSLDLSSPGLTASHAPDLRPLFRQFPKVFYPFFLPNPKEPEIRAFLPGNTQATTRRETRFLRELLDIR